MWPSLRIGSRILFQVIASAGCPPPASPCPPTVRRVRVADVYLVLETPTTLLMWWASSFAEAARAAVSAALRAPRRARPSVHPPRARQLDLEMRRQAAALQDLLLDLGREDVDAAQDDHVVGAAGDLLHPPHRPRRARQQPGQVAGAVADDRQRLLGQRGEDQLAHLAVRQHRAGLGVDDLGVEVVLPDVQPVLGLDAFVGDAGPHHLGQAVDVDRVHVEGLLDLLRASRWSRARRRRCRPSASSARGSRPWRRNSSRIASM